MSKKEIIFWIIWSVFCGVALWVLWGMVKSLLLLTLLLNFTVGQ